MNHPGEADLALFAGGDLNFFGRLRIGAHLKSCGQCRSDVEWFGAASAAIGRSAELPARLNWDRLADEMTANIKLGLEAGECVAASMARPDPFGWRAAAVMASMTVMLLAAWWLNFPQRRSETFIRSSQIEIRTTPAGIELNENGNALTLMHTRGGQKPLVVGTPGMLRARYVDEETGQVTINNVYAD